MTLNFSFLLEPFGTTLSYKSNVFFIKQFSFKPYVFFIRPFPLKNLFSTKLFLFNDFLFQNKFLWCNFSFLISLFLDYRNSSQTAPFDEIQSYFSGRCGGFYEGAWAYVYIYIYIYVQLSVPCSDAKHRIFRDSIGWTKGVGIFYPYLRC